SHGSDNVLFSRPARGDTVTARSSSPCGSELMQAICTLSTSAAGVIGLLTWLLSGVATAAVPAPFPVRHGAAVGAVAFSPDGKRIASGGDDAILRVSDVASGKEKHT